MRRSICCMMILLCCLTSAVFAQGRDLTVLMNSDTHFGFSGSINRNRANIQAMNGMAGTAYPASIGGTVGTPSGVTVAGDLTDEARYGERDDYLDHYPLNGGTGVNEIHYPVKELTGNHDRREPWWYFGATPVRDAIEARQGALRYSWDWQGVHFASLDIYPYESHCDWLANDLAAIAPETPVVLLSHYGYTTWDQDWWDDWSYQSQYFKNTIDGYNVVALVHGHSHHSQHYTWEGYDVYSPGSPKEVANSSFGVMNITDSKLTWAEYGYDTDANGNLTGGDWTWTDEKQLTPEVHYTFVETSPGTWEVLVEVDGEYTAGLSAYEIWVDGVDPATVSYVENALGTFINSTFVGFAPGTLVQGDVGGNFNAGNYQGNGDAAIDGIGKVAVDENGTPIVDLDAQALLGILTTGTGLGAENFRVTAVGLLNRLGDGYYNATDIVPTVDVIPYGSAAPVPEPATIALLGLGLFGVIRRKRS